MGRVFDRVGSFALDDTDRAPKGAPRGHDVGSCLDGRPPTRPADIAPLVPTKAGEGAHEVFV